MELEGVEIPADWGIPTAEGLVTMILSTPDMQAFRDRLIDDEGLPALVGIYPGGSGSGTVHVGDISAFINSRAVRLGMPTAVGRPTFDVIVWDIWSDFIEVGVRIDDQELSLFWLRTLDDPAWRQVGPQEYADRPRSPRPRLQ